MTMNTTRHVAVLLDTLRKHSFNHLLADELAALAPPDLRLEAVDISRLGLYNAERDKHPPPEWTLFRQQIFAADGLLFMMHEGHCAVPGVLRNALEIAAHPRERNAWAGKPGCIISVSPDAIARCGTVDRNLRRELLACDVPIMEQPDPYLVRGTGLRFDPAGGLMRDEVRVFLQQYVDAFNRWINRRYLH